MQKLQKNFQQKDILLQFILRVVQDLTNPRLATSLS